MHGKPFLITGGPVQHTSQVPSLQWQCQCPVLVWLCGRAGTAPSLLLTILRKVVARGCQRMVKLQKSSQVLADSQCLCRLWKQSADLLKKSNWYDRGGFWGWEGVSGKSRCVLVLLLHLSQVTSSTCLTFVLMGFHLSFAFKLCEMLYCLFLLPISDTCWSGVDDGTLG